MKRNTELRQKSRKILCCRYIWMRNSPFYPPRFDDPVYLIKTFQLYRMPYVESLAIFIFN